MFCTLTRCQKQYILNLTRNRFAIEIIESMLYGKEIKSVTYDS